MIDPSVLDFIRDAHAHCKYIGFHGDASLGSMGAAANVHYGLGFTGGGVGPSHLAGKILSGLALGEDDEFTRLPLVGIEPKKFPPEPLLSPGAAITQAAMVRKDEAEDDGRRANPLVNLVARMPRRVGYHLGP